MTIDTTGLPLQKPKDREGKVTLTEKQRRAKLDELCKQQKLLCCTCRRRMTREAGFPSTATLGHRNPQPMGAKKRDNDDNILGAQCWACNSLRGSKRD